MRLIDYDSAIDIVRDELKRVPPYAIRAMMRLEQLQVVESPSGLWIPVTPETLPDKDERVLVTVAEGGMIFVDTDAGNYYDDGSGWFWYSYNTVLAWMPIPKPYSPQIER